MDGELREMAKPSESLITPDRPAATPRSSGPIAALPVRSPVRPAIPEAPPVIRVVLADDHPIFRDGLRRLIESEPGFAVVGEAGDGAEAVRLVAALKPDILLIDLAMPVMSGLQTLRALGERGLTACRVLLLTAAIDREQTMEALQLGARGIVPKEAATATLFKGIRVVMRDEYWVGRNCVADVIRHMREATRREPVNRACGE